MALILIALTLVLAFANGSNDAMGILSPSPSVVHPYAGRAAFLEPKRLSEFWVHLLQTCNISCTHCLVGSGPKGDKGPDAAFLKAVIDEEGHLFPRGEAIEVCTDTAAKLKAAPYAGNSTVTEPDGSTAKVAAADQEETTCCATGNNGSCC